ncbi:fibronectin type III domain-containing protein [Streptomyces chumphonensis]|uniref:fibronectin type III domain-containing protein n=1 Tax=Streptomyces chumphonensis TaxID=1214925 RepID=UPI003D7429F7
MRRTVPLAALTLAATLPLTACAAEAQEGANGPEAPAGLTVHAGTATSVHVMWNRADAGEDVSAYEVHRDGERVAEVPGETYMVDVDGLRPSSAYTFTVRAKDAAGNLSPASDTATLTTDGRRREAPRTVLGPAGHRGPHHHHLRLTLPSPLPSNGAEVPPEHSGRTS